MSCHATREKVAAEEAEEAARLQKASVHKGRKINQDGSDELAARMYMHAQKHIDNIVRTAHMHLTVHFLSTMQCATQRNTTQHNTQCNIIFLPELLMMVMMR
jgi:hypothetical protein